MHNLHARYKKVRKAARAITVESLHLISKSMHTVTIPQPSDKERGSIVTSNLKSSATQNNADLENYSELWHLPDFLHKETTSVDLLGETS